jgi:hypothetical protein
MNLYWATTDDHHEDWFIVAKTERQAAYKPNKIVTRFTCQKMI